MRNELAVGSNVVGPTGTPVKTVLGDRIILGSTKFIALKYCPRFL